MHLDRPRATLPGEETYIKSIPAKIFTLYPHLVTTVKENRNFAQSSSEFQLPTEGNILPDGVEFYGIVHVFWAILQISGFPNCKCFVWLCVLHFPVNLITDALSSCDPLICKSVSSPRTSSKSNIKLQVLQIPAYMVYSRLNIILEHQIFQSSITHFSQSSAASTPGSSATLEFPIFTTTDLFHFKLLGSHLTHGTRSLCFLHFRKLFPLPST